jgi:hypothetical protein
MKTILSSAAACGLVLCSLVRAQETKSPTQEQLEAKFKETMAAVTLSGRWCSLKDGMLGESKEDKYTILGVEKVSGDSWVINARLQYGKRDVVAPIPVQVKWAGDVAVIIVDKLQIPGPAGYGGTAYSARLAHSTRTPTQGTGAEEITRGLMNGVITKDTAAKAEPK